MTTPSPIQRAVERAIEGGYKDVAVNYENFGDGIEYTLDPLFWQALSKAEGWDNNAPHTTSGYEFSSTGWETYWHRFITHLAEGKSPEDFFTALLADNK